MKMKSLTIPPNLSEKLIPPTQFQKIHEWNILKKSSAKIRGKTNFHSKILNFTNPKFFPKFHLLKSHGKKSEIFAKPPAGKSLECKKSELAPPFWQPILDPCTIPAKEFVPNWRQELENHRVFSNSSTIGRESNSSLPLECKKNKVGYLVLATNGLHTIPAKVRTTLDKTHIFPDIWQKTHIFPDIWQKNTYLSRYLAKQQFFLSRSTLQNQLCTLFYILFYTSKRCFWNRFLFLCFLGNSRVFFVF